MITSIVYLTKGYWPCGTTVERAHHSKGAALAYARNCRRAIKVVISKRVESEVTRKVLVVNP